MGRTHIPWMCFQRKDPTTSGPPPSAPLQNSRWPSFDYCAACFLDFLPLHCQVANLSKTHAKTLSKQFPRLASQWQISCHLAHLIRECLVSQPLTPAATSTIIYINKSQTLRWRGWTRIWPILVFFDSGFQDDLYIPSPFKLTTMTSSLVALVLIYPC